MDHPVKNTRTFFLIFGLAVLAVSCVALVLWFGEGNSDSDDLLAGRHGEAAADSRNRDGSAAGHAAPFSAEAGARRAMRTPESEASASPEESARLASAWGRVSLAPDLSPLADVEVELLDDRSPVASTEPNHTDRDGRYELGGIDPRRKYVLRVRHRELGERILGPLQFKDGERRELRRIVFGSGGGLSGVVLDKEMRPIPESEVALNPRFGPSPRTTDAFEPPIPWAKTKTDEEGQFVFDGLPTGHYVVGLRATGFGMTHFYPYFVTGRERRTESSFELAAGVIIEGRVVEDEDRPLPNVVVTAAPSGSRPLLARPCFRSIAVTNEDGIFVLDDLEPGNYRLHLRAPDGRLEMVRRTEAPKSSTLLIRFAKRLKAEAGELTGRIIERGTGKPLPEVPVRIGPSTVKSDEAGRYRSGPLPAGRYQPHVHTPDFCTPPDPGSVHLEGGNETIWDVEVEPTGSVSGRVVDGFTGKGIEGARIGYGSIRERSESGLTTDAEGRFTLPGQRTGKYFLPASADGFLAGGVQIDPPLRSGESRSVDIRLQRAVTIRGLVRTLEGPVRGARIDAVQGSAWRARIGGRFSGQAISDRDGRYEVLVPFAPLRLKVVASHPNHAPATETLHHLALGEVYDVEFLLDSGQPLVGRVRNLEGEAQPGVQLRLMTKKSQFRFVSGFSAARQIGLATRSDVEGWFEFLAGSEPCGVSVVDPDYAEISSNLSEPALARGRRDDGEIVVAPAVTFRLRVGRPSGKRNRTCYLRLVLRRGKSVTWSKVYRVRRANFEEKVPEGKYDAYVSWTRSSPIMKMNAASLPRPSRRGRRPQLPARHGAAFGIPTTTSGGTVSFR